MSGLALTLFLSGGKSLGWWAAEGVFTREMALYRQQLASGVLSRVLIFSYDAADRAFLAEQASRDPLMAQIELIAPPVDRRGIGWGLRGVWAHRRAIAATDLIKTNQISGSWAAIWASLLCRRPLLLRMGYILSRRFALNGERAKASAARLIEWAGMRRARIISVSAEAAREELAARAPSAASRIRLMPTYVDVDTFSARAAGVADAGLIAVGRLRPQKNLPELIRAVALAGRPLTLVGKGEQEAELRALAQAVGANVRFIAQIDNDALAALLRDHARFILPSLHEGLPKVLIEAMASGLVVIGSRIPGITDLIRDGDTGYLIDGFDAAAIAAAISRADAADAGMGGRARAVIEERFGLRRYARAEAALYAEVVQHG